MDDRIFRSSWSAPQGLSLGLERQWMPVFDATAYSNVGALIAAIKQEDIAAIRAIDGGGTIPTCGNGDVRSTRATTVRIFKDLKNACTWANWVSIAPISDKNIRNCLATLEGPKDTPYEGGVFWLLVQFPPSYPLMPPIIRFLTQVYHPNISHHGNVCVDILEKKWSPVQTIAPVLASIHLLLGQPEWKDPLVREIAREFRENRADFMRTAKEWTEKFALQERPCLSGVDEL